MTGRTVWRTAFLALTAVVLGMELWAANDGRPETDPWTSLIIDYVPAPVTYTAVLTLVLWLPGHFAVRYIRRRRNLARLRREYEAARLRGNGRLTVLDAAPWTAPADDDPDRPTPQ